MAGLWLACALAAAGMPRPLLGAEERVRPSASASPSAKGDDADEAARADDIVTARTDPYLRMTVSTTIADVGPFRFLVDTGAQNTVISDALAARLALPRGPVATVVGVAGRTVVGTVIVDGLALGRRRYNHLTAPILVAQDIGADGIVGLDALQDQRILIDFPHGLVMIGDAADEGGDHGFEIVVRARRRSGQIIITTATIDGVPVDVVLDTGAESTIGNFALQRTFSRRQPPEQSLVQSVTGQSLPVAIQLARSMTLGRLEMRDVPIAFADAPPFAQLGLARRPAILLGMSELRAFKRIAIDFRQRKVLFDLMDAH